ncbi:MAG: thioredoxin 2 [Acidimicrobiaceae bacterium]|jgi:thioredoxin 2
MTSQIVVCDVCGTKNRVPAAATGSPRCGKCQSPLPWLAEADDATFTEVVEQSGLPVLIDLWAPWCGPCRAVSPALEHLAHELRGRIKLVKVNVDEAQQVARRFEVQGIPTLVLMDRGNVISRQVGAAPEAALRTWLEQALDTVEV